MPYQANNWTTGDIITAERLNALENGLAGASAQAEQAGSMTANATTLAAGSEATASYFNGTLTLGIPKGDKGDPGEPGQDGAPGAQGPAGANGANGASIRISATAVTASTATPLSGLVPSNDTLPVKQGDIVLDITTNTLYEVQSVDETNYTPGTALGTLAGA